MQTTDSSGPFGSLSSATHALSVSSGEMSSIPLARLILQYTSGSVMTPPHSCNEQPELRWGRYCFSREPSDDDEIDKGIYSTLSEGARTPLISSASFS